RPSAQLVSEGFRYITLNTQNKRTELLLVTGLNAVDPRVLVDDSEMVRRGAGERDVATRPFPAGVGTNVEAAPREGRSVGRRRGGAPHAVGLRDSCTGKRHGS